MVVKVDFDVKYMVVVNMTHELLHPRYSYKYQSEMFN